MGQECRIDRLRAGRQRRDRQISVPMTQQEPTTMSIEQRLKDLGVTLPQVGGPLGNYAHAKRVGNLLFLSGKGPPDSSDGKLPRGKLGAGMSIDEGYRHARGVGLVLIAALKDALA